MFTELLTSLPLPAGFFDFVKAPLFSVSRWPIPLTEGSATETRECQISGTTPPRNPALNLNARAPVIFQQKAYISIGQNLMEEKKRKEKKVKEKTSIWDWEKWSFSNVPPGPAISASCDCSMITEQHEA